jgi:hypothetical protein
MTFKGGKIARPGVNVIKLFTVVIYKVPNRLVFIPDRLFQPSLRFIGKARSLYYSGAPEKFSTQVCSSLADKH